MEIATLRIPTPLGEVDFAGQANIAPRSKRILKAVRFQPSLPPGKSVEGCFGILFRFDEIEFPGHVLFQATLHSEATIQQSPHTGEALEAVEWSDGRHLVLVGTEDATSLQGRLGFYSAAEESFTYSPGALSVLASAEPGQPFSLHFLVAWNPLPEPQELSCWFAVEQPHSAIERAVGQ